MHNDLLDTVLVCRKDASSLNRGDSDTANTMKGPGTTLGDGDAKCPVDHKTREVWLTQARAASTSSQDSPQNATPSTLPSSASSAASAAATQPSQAPTASTSQWTWRIPFFSSGTPATVSETSPPTAQGQNQQPIARPSSLSTARQVSSIPRASQPGPSACPANHEAETGADVATGRWVYPSERMFFEAMRRKGTAGGAREEDMRAVVPMHNAVNERAWLEITQWEAPYLQNSSCDGPRLHSFAGLSTKMSPKARLNTLLGYTAPFDRHDWVVDRCGTRVEYVIDFYAGRQDRSGSPGRDERVSFYLDVRPKLNSWEGIKMRVARGLGLV